MLTSRQELNARAEDERQRKSDDHTWDERDVDGRGYLPNANGSFMHLARSARDNGYRPLVPLHSYPYRDEERTSKVPFICKWQQLAVDPPSDAQMRFWLQRNPNLGWGYAHNKKLVVFDIDTPEKERSTAMIDWLLGYIPGPPPMMRTSVLPRVQLYYRAGNHCHQEKTPEIFHSSGQTVLFAVHPKHARPFSWRYGSPALRHIADLPVCDGYHELQFIKAWGGPLGNGDLDARLGKGNGNVRSFLKFCRDNHIVLLDIYDCVRAVKIFPEGQRHNLAVGAVAYARHHMHASIELIDETITVAYEELLRSSMSGRELNKQLKDYYRLIGWTDKKVSEGD